MRANSHEPGRARSVRPGPCSGPARPRTRPASSSSRRASCAPQRSGPWPGGPASRRGVSVLDLCCGVAGPGRFITRELGCTYLGVDSSSSAVDIARERAGDLPCRFELARIPPIPPGPFDVVLLFETMLAFPDKESLLEEISRALRPGGRFAFTMEEGLPLTEAERERMPDADTVWLTPLPEMLTCLERVGLRVRWQEDYSRSHRAVADSLLERVRRRRYGHRRADRAQGTGGAAGRPPALERLAAGRTGSQDRFRCREDGDAKLSITFTERLRHRSREKPCRSPGDSIETTPGPSEWFTGSVYIDAVAAPSGPRA